MKKWIMNLPRTRLHVLPVILGFWLVAGGLCSAAAIAAQAKANSDVGPEISATVSRNSVQVAEPFSLEIQCVAPAMSKVVFPPEAKQIGDFDVIEVSDAFDVPGSSSDGLRTWTRKMTLESIVTGRLEIPAVEIQVSVTGRYDGLSTKPLEIEVLSVLEDRPDPTSFRDIKPLVELELAEEKTTAWRWWAGGIIGLTFLAGCALFATRFRNRLTPQQWATEQLNKIEFESREQDGKAKAEYVTGRVASVVRDFLEMEFAIPASTLTTSELVEAVHARQIGQTETRDAMRELFAIADQAKYAGLSLSSQRIDAVSEEARELIREIAATPTTVERN
ncbi:MAG: BatD family protein [Mariniblastus sp.]